MTDDLQKFLEELRARISIAEIVGEKVKLSKRGREYLGLCPFHHEKTPSFTINEAKGFYHCFGCGEHGDIVKFLMTSEGLPFIEAVKKLASRAGMELPEFSPESQQANARRKSFYEIMDMAADFFEKNLRMPIGAKGLDYFKNKRGLSEDIIKKFRLGYAPDNNGLKALLLSKGIAEKDLQELGLISASHDFFRDRVMIPIMDKQNNVIAFGGRIMDNSQPKYLNSPETPIFNKRRILYNMNNAREVSYANKRLIICEGYMDVIALDCFNFSYAVAPLGTALTEEQIIEAWKVCNTPTLCFDGDTAGVKAAIRSVDRVLPILRPGYSVNYIFLKEKKDPDELLHTLGPQVFEQYLQRAKPLVDILWHKCKMNKGTQTPEEKALIEKETLEEVNKIQNPQIRNYYGQEMKKRIYYTFGKGSVYPQKNNKQKNYKNNSDTGYNFVKKTPLNDSFMCEIVAAMVTYPELIGKYEERLTAFDMDKSVMFKILAEIIEIYQDDPQIESDILQEKLRLNFAKEIDNLWQIKMYKEQKTALLDIKAEIDSGLKKIELKQIEKSIKECSTLIQKEPENADLLMQYKQLNIERENILAEQK